MVGVSSITYCWSSPTIHIGKFHGVVRPAVPGHLEQDFFYFVLLFFYKEEDPTSGEQNTMGGKAKTP